MRMTIGMPVYNGAATIAAALDSLLAQSFADFDLVISDNGSSDTTEIICRGYAKRDPRIRYVRQPINLGAAMNFHFVLFAARTPFFMWAAADDLWAPGFIATHLQALENDPGAVASQSKVLFTKGGRPSHLSTGTYALSGTQKENLSKFLANPADNSRFYAVFRTHALQAAFPARNFHALDWGVSAATLRYGTHLEIDQVLMIRDSSDAAVYENAVGRDHSFVLWRMFPVLFLTKWLIFTRHIPLNPSILRSLLKLNLYLHFRFGMYRSERLAKLYFAPNGRLLRAVSALLRPGLRSRLRQWRAPLAQPLRRTARAVWRKLPLSLAQRESVKGRLVQTLGDSAMEIVGVTDYARIRSSRTDPIPPDPRERGVPENIWQLRATGIGGGDPVLSVVLVVRNQLADTLRCIDALYGSGQAVEIVVVDNASTDVTSVVLGAIPAISLHRLASPMLFGDALQIGLRSATAPAVAVLEAGMVPSPDFPAEVLHGLQETPLIVAQVRNRAGLVRSMGGYFSSESFAAAGWQRLPPSHPLCAARRVADYAQGAFAFAGDVRRAQFDLAYLPSLELISRCYVMQANAIGFDASYCPKAAVYQLADDVVDLSSAPASRTTHQPSVLYVDADTPAPDRNAGSIEALNLMRLLRGFGFRVLFVPESNFAYRGRYTDAVLDLGIHALYANYFDSLRQVLEQFGRDLEVVILCRAYIAERYIGMVRDLAPQARIIFYTVDLHFLRDERGAELNNDPAARQAAEASRKSELASIAASDATVVLSTHEHELLTALLPRAKVHVIPLVRNVPERLDVPGFAGRRDCMFIGTYQHPPNEDAVIYFATEIWPLVRPRLPGARFLIVGSSVTPKIEALADDTIQVPGYVEDLDGLLATSRLTVAPLRFGAGLKGKLASSLQAGVPAVASRIAVEGSGLSDGEQILVADSPEQFADAVVRVYQDQALWERLSKAGFDFVRREYSVDVNAGRVKALLTAVGVENLG